MFFCCLGLALVEMEISNGYTFLVCHLSTCPTLLPRTFTPPFSYSWIPHNSGPGTPFSVSLASMICFCRTFRCLEDWKDNLLWPLMLVFMNLFRRFALLVHSHVLAYTRYQYL